MAKRKQDETAGIGDNSVAPDQVRAFVERIERLEEEKRGIADDIKDVYAEAKGNGFDAKILRAVVARRRLDRAERDEFDAMLAVYEGIFG